MSKPVLYSSPRACSTACHIAFEESGIDYRCEILRIREGETRSADYLAINPAGKVPALVTNERVLTETPAIMIWIANHAAPQAALLPHQGFDRYRAHEWMSFLTSTVHLAFRPLFRPAQFVDDEALYPIVRSRGGAQLREVLLEVERRLQGKTWALGDRYSVVDPYLFVFHTWSQRDNIRPFVAEMPAWMAQRQRVESRAATSTVLAREGITSDNITDP